MDKTNATRSIAQRSLAFEVHQALLVVHVLVILLLETDCHRSLQNRIVLRPVTR